MFLLDILLFISKIILFIAIIFGVQYGWNTIKDTYTKPKTKYLVNSQLKKYKDLVGDMYNQNKENEVQHNDDILFETDEDKKQMNDDLLDFINAETKSYIN